MVMVAKALVVVAVEVAMAVADMPTVDLAAAGMPAVDLAAAAMAAALARKRKVADNYCEREKHCYGRRTHGFRLHPPERQKGNQLLHRPPFRLLVALIKARSQYWPLGVVSGFRSTRPVHPNSMHRQRMLCELRWPVITRYNLYCLRNSRP
jgi:hypothetical protein